MTQSLTKQPLCLPSLRLLGDYWTLRIVDELSAGALRFCELERRLVDINSATLTKRLKTMQQDGMLVRTELSRADVTYGLSELGQEALPLLDAVNNYSAKARQLVGVRS